MSSPERLYKITNELSYVGAPLLEFVSIMERMLYIEKLDERLDITGMVSKLVGYVESLKNAAPGSEYARTMTGKAHDLLTKKVKPAFEELKSYRKWDERFWSSDVSDAIDKYVNQLLYATEKPLETAIKDIGYERKVMDDLYRAGKLSKEPPKKRKLEAEAVAKVVGMLIILAFGFAMLNGLRNMQAASSAGALPGIETGFFMLPGGPFVSSLQMVLFMLASAVVVMYLAGKALGGW